MKQMTRLSRSLQFGFTLLEILLVLFLIGLMASATLMLTENVEDQAKYDETKRRMEMMRNAIVGDPTRTVNGSPEISGFVADMGRLPICIAELLELGDEKSPSTIPKTYKSSCDASQTITIWSIDVSTGIGSGWRGPYIQVLTERNGDLRFRDGYGNSDSSTALDAQNSGWTYEYYMVPETISIESKGFDLNSTSDDISNLNLVVPNDYKAYLQYWDIIQVQFQNISTAQISFPADSLRLKLSYPENGSINSWPDLLTDRDNSDYLSTTFPSHAITIPSASGPGFIGVLTTDTITVPAGSSLVGTNLTFTVPGNISFPDGMVSVTPADTLNVPASSSLLGSSLTISIDGSMSLPAGSIVTLNSGLQFPENIASVIGHYSLVIACDDTTNEAAVSGQRFDGDCTRYGTDLSPIAYTAFNQPYLFKAAPRNGVIAPPNPLLWTIQ